MLNRHPFVDFIEMIENPKTIVFCHTCNRIVGEKFPILDHGHSLGLRNELLRRKENLQYLGYGFYYDTPEIRAILPEPRDEIVIKL